MSDQEREQSAQAALVGGLVSGVLAILPLVNIGNICCGLWSILGGMLTARLYLEKAQAATNGAGFARLPELNDVLKCAASAGILGAIIRVFLGLPIDLALLPRLLPFLEQAMNGMQNERLRGELMKSAQRLQHQSTMETLVDLLPGALLGATILFLATLGGGFIGYRLFAQHQTPTLPPPEND